MGSKFIIKTSKALNILLGCILLFIYIYGAWLIDWHKVMDPISHLVYHYFFIPIAVLISLISFTSPFIKSQNFFLCNLHFIINIVSIFLLGLWASGFIEKVQL